MHRNLGKRPERAQVFKQTIPKQSKTVERNGDTNVIHNSKPHVPRPQANVILLVRAGCFHDDY